MNEDNSKLDFVIFISIWVTNSVFQPLSLVCNLGVWCDSTMLLKNPFWGCYSSMSGTQLKASFDTRNTKYGCVRIYHCAYRLLQFTLDWFSRFHITILQRVQNIAAQVIVIAHTQDCTTSIVVKLAQTCALTQSTFSFIFTWIYGNCHIFCQ